MYRTALSESVVTEAEAFSLLETIRSTRTEGSNGRIYLPQVRCSCAWCGKDFILKGYEWRKKVSRGTKNVFCSKECFQAYESKKGAEKHKCIRCGAPVKKGQKYCQACLQDARRWKSGTGKQPIKKLCEFCGKPFLAAHRGHGIYARFCCMDCKNAFHSASMKAEANVRFKNWADRRRNKGSVQKAYRALRHSVLERDGFSCVLCGETENLTVHHVNLNPESNEMRNLVTLCRKCHEEAHRQEVRGTYEENILPKLNAYLSTVDP